MPDDISKRLCVHDIALGASTAHHSHIQSDISHVGMTPFMPEVSLLFQTGVKNALSKCGGQSYQML